MKSYKRISLLLAALFALALILAQTALSQTTHSVALAWTEATSGVTFNVYRAAASSCSGMSIINLSPVTVTNYTDTNVSGGGTYSYYVTAVGTGGESAPSSCVTVQIPTAPSAPQGLTATVK